MTSTSAGPSLGSAQAGTDTERWTPRLVGLLIALIWPTQLLAIAAIAGANAIPEIAEHFRTTQIAWYGLIPNLVTTPLTPFAFKLGDRFGRRRVMLALIGLGVIGDVIAAAAGNYWLVVVGRGIAACYGPFAVLSFPAVRDLFPRRLVKPASAFLGASMGLVGLIAPFLAGWLLGDWGFRGVLWFIAGSTAIAGLLVFFLVPETPRHDFQDGFDWPGGLLLGAGLTGVVYALGEGQTWGWTSVQTLAWLLGGLVLLGAFMLVERASSHPILDFAVLRRRPVAVAVNATALGQGTALTMAGMTILLAVYPHIPGVSDGLGWSSWHNAEVGVSWNLSMILAGYLAGRVLRRVAARPVWMFGLIAAAAGFGLMAFFHSTTIELAVTQCIAQIGMGVVVATGPVVVVGVVTPDEQGQGTGAFQMISSVVSSIVSAAAYGVLLATGVVRDGTAFYVDAGYRLVFLIGAGVLVLALLLSTLLPRLAALPRDAAAADA